MLAAIQEPLGDVVGKQLIRQSKGEEISQQHWNYFNRESKWNALLSEAAGQQLVKESLPEVVVTQSLTNSLLSGQTSWEAASQRAGIQQLVKQSLIQETNMYLPVFQPKRPSGW